jgi:hypothetical protein
VEYLANEKDSDLVVHGIRLLEATKGEKATKCLMSLLKHESWQVRAEAAASIGKVSEASRMNFSGMSSDRPDAAAKLQADAYVALLDLLDDADAFVVAKAIEGLAHADLAVAVEPLARAATKHPDMAARILEMLAQGNNMRTKAIPHLRKFCAHELPKVRAAAITAICQAASDGAGEELLAALGDADSEVCIAAASALFNSLDSRRRQALSERQGQALRRATAVPMAEAAGFWGQAAQLWSAVMSPQPAASQEKKEDKPAEKDADQEKNPSDAWLEECYAGRHRPSWTTTLAPLLEKMLAAETPDERIAAARALVPLGKSTEALPVMEESLRAKPELFGKAASILPWLTWEQRLATFKTLRALAANEQDDIVRLHATIIDGRDPRAANLLWEALTDAKLSRDDAAALARGLMEMYFGDQIYNASNAPASSRRELAKAATPRTQTGSGLQRMAALMLLTAASHEDAAKAAGAMADDAQLEQPYRSEAFQVQLAALPATEARKVSLATLRGTDVFRIKPALKWLAEGSNAHSTLASELFPYIDFDPMSGASVTTGVPIVPKAPIGLEAKDIRPFVNDADAEVAACAGYLLAVLGESEGVEPLVRYWQQHGKTTDNWSKMVYRAIAAVNDPKYIGVLQEIYAKLQGYERQEFYWTIRIMTGPEILAFRKQIRDEMKKASEF